MYACVVVLSCSLGPTEEAMNVSKFVLYEAAYKGLIQRAFRTRAWLSAIGTASSLSVILVILEDEGRLAGKAEDSASRTMGGNVVFF